MSDLPKFEINRYNFDETVLFRYTENHQTGNLWPVVYILGDGNTKHAYIGETTDTRARMLAHLSNEEKSKLKVVRFITSDKFHKSATLDIESNLIKYMFADKKFSLLNGNMGLANHNYHQKKTYWKVFESIWQKLRSEGMVTNSLEAIDNSDMFKYSPYKSLSTGQKEGLKAILEGLLDGNTKNIVIEGGAGTGKTVIAVFLFKLLNTPVEEFSFQDFGEGDEKILELVYELKKRFPKPEMALVIPVTSFRETVQDIFNQNKGLTSKMVVGPTEVTKKKYDIIVVDEAHRLRRRLGLTNYRAFDQASEKLGLDKYTCSELDWVLMQGENTVLFYDEDQSVRPADVEKKNFDKVINDKFTKVARLKSQFRINGGQAFVDHIYDLLNCRLNPLSEKYSSKDYEFWLFDDLEEMVEIIKDRDEQYGISRLIAGYAWEWVSKRKKEEYDIIIGNTKLRWNRVGKGWINSVGAINEVGCIHTTQGYDLNYAGIIFGKEISYDKEKNEMVVIPENYHDRKGNLSIIDPEELKRYIINIYNTILKRGKHGIYVYAVDENMREYLAQHIHIFRKNDPAKYTIVEGPTPLSIPVYDLKVAAGNFSDPQNPSQPQYWIELTDRRANSDLFACKVIGESMNKIIPNGALCLFRKDPGGSRNGRIVLVQSTSIQDLDYNSGYTVKEYHSKKETTEEGWSHQSITLKPLSHNPEFSAIQLKEDDFVDFRVIGVFKETLD